jgi:hypothetical protein
VALGKEGWTNTYIKENDEANMSKSGLSASAALDLLSQTMTFSSSNEFNVGDQTQRHFHAKPSTITDDDVDVGTGYQLINASAVHSSLPPIIFSMFPDVSRDELLSKLQKPLQLDIFRANKSSKSVVLHSHKRAYKNSYHSLDSVHVPPSENSNGITTSNNRPTSIRAIKKLRQSSTSSPSTTLISLNDCFHLFEKWLLFVSTELQDYILAKQANSNGNKKAHLSLDQLTDKTGKQAKLFPFTSFAKYFDSEFQKLIVYFFALIRIDSSRNSKLVSRTGFVLNYSSESIEMLLLLDGNTLGSRVHVPIRKTTKFSIVWIRSLNDIQKRDLYEYFPLNEGSFLDSMDKFSTFI